MFLKVKFRLHTTHQTLYSSAWIYRSTQPMFMNVSSLFLEHWIVPVRIELHLNILNVNVMITSLCVRRMHYTQRDA